MNPSLIEYRLLKQAKKCILELRYIVYIPHSVNVVIS